MTRGRLRGEAGQATIEALAAIPLLVAVALLALQMAAVIGAALEAERAVRAEAVAAAAEGRSEAIAREATAPRFLPGRPPVVARRVVVRDCMRSAC